MENQPQNPQIPQMPMGMPQQVPNATASLVLGIISIPTCVICYFSFGIVGLTCGIIAIVLGSKASKVYQENPSIYNVSSYNNAKAGRICGIIGVILNAILFLILIIYLIAAGTMISSSDFPFGRGF